MVRLQLRIRFPYGVTHRVFLLIPALLPVILSSMLVVYRVRATVPDSPSTLNATLGVRQFYLGHMSRRTKPVLPAPRGIISPQSGRSPTHPVSSTTPL
jgi:hypothetical protein